MACPHSPDIFAVMACGGLGLGEDHRIVFIEFDQYKTLIRNGCPTITDIALQILKHSKYSCINLWTKLSR